MIMNNEENKEKKPIEVVFDTSTNEEDINIEEIIENWDGSAYGTMKWDHEKKKWVKSRL